jgi:hypothetical protein
VRKVHKLREDMVTACGLWFPSAPWNEWVAKTKYRWRGVTCGNCLRLKPTQRGGRGK